MSAQGNQPLPHSNHRLDPDIEANAAAWERYRHRYASNPAREPDRWSTGLGLYGQIPALWLARWDVEAPPETLCGEVEATEVHLRAARDQVRKVRRGADCDGDGEPDYWGSACEEGSGTCEPSWYDVSSVNSGSLCPGDREHREAFERRAESLGLDPWAPVDVAMLGRGVAIFGVHLRDIVTLLGQVILDAAYLVRHPERFPWRELSAGIFRTGAQALGITALVGFLIGVTLSYLSSNQLKNFGADAFIVNILGMSIIRELGPMLAAVLIAGRSGSAMTAQLGGCG